MQKQMKLTIGMALLFLVTFVFFGVIILYEKGNLLLYPILEKKLTDYFEKNYQEIKEEVQKKELKFNFDDKSYSIEYQNKKHPDLSFFLLYTKKKKIQSTYQEDYIEGKTLLDKKCKKISKEIQKLLQNENFSSIQVKKKRTLNEVNTKEKKKLLEGEGKEISFYQVVVTTSLSNLDGKEIQKILKKMDTILEEEDYNPETYQAKFLLSEDKTRGVKIQNITREILQKNQLETILYQLYQTKEKIDTKSKIEMEEF